VRLNGIKASKRTKVFTRRRKEGRASTLRTEEWMEIVQMCLTEDRTLSVRMLEEMTEINTETVREVLIEF
jgi:hypothetical protein